MKKLVLLLLVAGCASGGSLSSMSSFQDVPIGASEQEVVSSMGKPRKTKTNADGSVEYEYVERIKIGGRNAEERTYHIVIKDGKVVSKRVEYGSPTPWTFDSYEMQTTQSTF